MQKAITRILSQMLMPTLFSFLVINTIQNMRTSCIIQTPHKKKRQCHTCRNCQSHNCLQPFIDQSHNLHSGRRDHKHLLYQISNIHRHFINLGTVILLDISKNLDIIVFDKIYCYTLQTIKKKNPMSTTQDSSRQYNIITK